jgi:glycosyltransferase involved in cell wall biosynthesis
VRYAWDLQEQYLAESGLAGGLRGMMARVLLGRIREWDRRTAERPTRILAISEFIRERIRRVWGRESGVLYPPVETAVFGAKSEERGARREDRGAKGEGGRDEGSKGGRALYVTASRFVPYKRIPLIVEAFRLLPDRDLVVSGDGPEWERAKAVAGANVQLLGHLPRGELRDWLGRADGFVFAAEEDFGIAPVEALAAGTPVLAYGKGGALETVGPGTGVFFESQTVEAIADGVRRLEAEVAAGRITPAQCRDWAERFSVRRFREGVLEAVRELVPPVA